ncbi:FMN-linked oxidoreductase [Armillaria solidipes]|uniref:FMN-linked oxidoreductase n=1 Tax=Armillaria solidipes TaxID=1076256 RepID=A0A2H3C1X5_9AGAR|nr:FMN-linked oxidoreductase [Armillaria solidipes]
MPSKLFQPTNVGNLELQHRVVLAPLTRFRTTPSGIPHTEIVKEYYTQRSQAPGTLLISEGILIAPKAGGASHFPGIWSQEMIAAWKQVTDSIHAKGSFIFCQLFAQGRSADPKVLAAGNPSYPYVSASAIPLSTRPNDVPRPLTIDEIHEYPQLFAQASLNAIEAGFDGVEIHGANGYLLDQFTQDVSNHRTDEYGGSIENRARFSLEIIDAVVKAIGAERTGYRVSPWNTFQDMTMADPKPTFSYLAGEIKQRYPNFAYLHAVEPRVAGTTFRDENDIRQQEENDFLREVWAPKPFISAGHSRETAIEAADGKGDLVAFGRQFISNPDLVRRLEQDLPLSPYDRATFYIPGNAAKGYTDYPFLN